MSEVIKKLFAADIQKNIFPKNKFYQGTKVDKGVAIDVLTVEIPQAGSKPTGGKNPTSFPLTIETREDDKKTYDVDLYYTNPIHVTDVNQAITSYDKRKDILEDKILKLNTDYANDLAYVWSPTVASNIIRTTGDAKATTLVGATGDRLALAIADFINADRIMNNMNVPTEGRRCLMSADMYAQLLTAGLQGFIGSDKLTSDLLAKGVVGRILNFDIYVRSTVARYDNSGTPVKKAVGSVNAVADNDVTLFFHPMFVRRAEGNVTVFYNAKQAEYLGDIFNASFRGGGCIPRTDEIGVVALVQAHD